MRVAIVGGGVAGLAAAHRLTATAKLDQKLVEVSLFESAHRAGGIIETVREHDCLVELGPDSFTTLKPAAINLCAEIGLSQNLISTNNFNRRAFIARNGRLNAIPEGFVMIAPTQYDSFFQSNILSRAGKLRMAFEQFIEPHFEPGDESVASFVRRRFGPEAVDCIAQPMMGGIYTADINQLSLRATMPKYLEYEKNFGSVAAGLRHEGKKSKLAAPNTTASTDLVSSSHESQSGGARYSAFVTLDGGMQMLADRLVEIIERSRVYFNQSVISLAKGVNNTWIVALADGTKHIFDRVVLAVPTATAARLMQAEDNKLYDSLTSIQYASSVVACLLVPRENISHALDGFGFVVPKKEGRGILACSFSSIKFPGRCSASHVLLRIFLGGALHPEVWQLSDDELLRIVVSDLSYYIGLSKPPERAWIKRWPNSMPQYNIGHLSRINDIEEHLSRLGGIYYAGAGLRGVGVPDCVSSGESAARSILADLPPVLC